MSSSAAPSLHCVMWHTHDPHSKTSLTSNLLMYCIILILAWIASCSLPPCFNHISVHVDNTTLCHVFLSCPFAFPGSLESLGTLGCCFPLQFCFPEKVQNCIFWGLKGCWLQVHVAVTRACEDKYVKCSFWICPATFNRGTCKTGFLDS